MKRTTRPQQQVKNESIDDLLQRLEVESNNEFDELLLLGTSFYSTNHLMEIQDKWLEQYTLFKRYYFRYILLAATSAFCTFACLICLFYSYYIFAAFCIALSLTSIFLFTANSLFLKRNFFTKKYFEKIGAILNEEIKIREDSYFS